MLKKRILGLLVLLVGGAIGYFIFSTTAGLGGTEGNKYDFKLGLDLSGGTSLVYRADVSNIDQSEVKDAMDSLHGVIERRSNLFGVSETAVYIEEAKFVNGQENRVIVDLPGVTDVEKAKEIIGKTPNLEFMFDLPDGPQKEKIIMELTALQESETASVEAIEDKMRELFVPSGLSGKYLEDARVAFSQGGAGMGQVGGEPIVSIKFNSEGTKIFETITREHVGEVLYIFLDGTPRNAPVINEAISGGEAIISGGFTPEEAKSIASDLKLGALPVPIELISTQTVGPSLGASAVSAGIFAALIGFAVLALLILFWYRLPGLVAIIALIIYSLLMFSVFKLIPVTLTAAGIAGFILSLGMAVDANILIFERMKEEMRSGKDIVESTKNGFDRAWSSIRDSNLSSIITAIILFWFGTALIQGFALTFGIGVLVSMISAIVVSKVLLLSITSKNNKVMRFLFSNGLTK